MQVSLFKFKSISLILAITPGLEKLETSALHLKLQGHILCADVISVHVLKEKGKEVTLFSFFEFP